MCNVMRFYKISHKFSKFRNLNVSNQYKTTIIEYVLNYFHFFENALEFQLSTSECLS